MLLLKRKVLTLSVSGRDEPSLPRRRRTQVDLNIKSIERQVDVMHSVIHDEGAAGRSSG